MAKIQVTSGSYTADTATDLYTNSTGATLLIMSMSVYNPETTSKAVEIYTVNSSNVVQEWVLDTTLTSRALIGNQQKIWLADGHKIRFKSAHANVKISANLYG